MNGGRLRITRLTGAERGALPDRIRCSICGFAGVNTAARPGESLGGDFRLVRTGSQYVWATPDEPVQNQDAQVVMVPNVRKACPFCGGQRFLDGRRGSAHAVPGG